MEDVVHVLIIQTDVEMISFVGDSLPGDASPVARSNILSWILLKMLLISSVSPTKSRSSTKTMMCAFPSGCFYTLGSDVSRM